MNPHREQRRSPRLSLRVPITVNWTPPAGHANVRESTRTEVVSAHGALIHLHEGLARGTRLEIIHQTSEDLAFARVVWVGKPETPDSPFPVGIELAAPNQAFWGDPRAFPKT